MMELKNKDVIVWKGVKWAKLFKFDKYAFTQLFIQLATFSRYTHTAKYIKFKDHEFIVQSNLIDGVHILDVTGETWFKSNIQNNIYDQYKFRCIKENSFQKSIQDKIKYMYENKLTKLNIAKYSKLGIFNQFLWQFFNLSVIKKTSENKFCSELTYYYFTEDIESFKISPQDLTNSDLFEKIL